MNSIVQPGWLPQNDRSRRQFIVDAAKALLGVGIAPSIGKLVAGEFRSRSQSPPRANCVIYLNMLGGVSHIDTFDPKPGAPEIQGPVESLATNVPGIHLTEYLPGLARQTDKLAIIRSMTSNQGDHNAAQYLLHRSYREGGTLSHPALAVWATRSLDKFNPDLPASVSIASNEDSISTGFLELKYAPVPINDAKQGLPDSHRPKYVTESRRASRIAMAQAFNEKFHAQYKYRQTSALASMFSDAVRLMSSKDLKAFDISLEPTSISDLYGPTPFGQGCMLARRLVEYGVRFVEVGLGGWDTHYDNFGGVEANAAVLDKGMSALLMDLEQRGLLDTTMVVLADKFGRDHHPNAFSCVLAGGGVQGGQVYGATDAKGAAVADRKVSIPDFNATIGWALGLPIEEKFTAQSGQQFQIAAEGQPLTALFS